MRKHSFCLLATVLMISTFAALALSKGESDKEQAVYVGGETCITCHADYDVVIKGTKHAIIFEDEKNGGSRKACESCHGPGSLHVDEGGDTEKIVLFDGNTDAEKMCLKCHSKGKTQFWKTSKHAEEGKTCTTCHKIHEKNDALLPVSQPELCFECHINEKGETALPSRHPVKEGKVLCSDCHDPHSNIEIEYSGSSATSKCMNCHQERLGPFAYEHEPVAENCMACHTPHGSVNKNLLAFKQPTLCFRCHADVVTNAQHPADYQTKRPSCANTECHTSIHGSNNDSKLHW